MAAPHSNAAKIQQIITEFFAKSLHVILESRTTPCVDSISTESSTSDSSQSSGVRPRDKWFNLALKECPSVYENLNAWCWSDPECMVIDVILIKRESDLTHREKNGEWRRGNIVERWVVKHEITRTDQPESSSKEDRPFSECFSPLMYQKSIVVLRLLYTTVRLLPAYKLFRKLNLSSNPCSCFLAHRVTSFPEPLDSKLEAEMQLHDFASLDTPCGKICLSVLYMSRVTELIHQTSSMSVAPKLIPDYMDISLAEPVKSIPSLPKAPDYLPLKRNNSTNKCQASPATFGSSTSSVHSGDKTSLPGKNECFKKKPLRTNFQDEFEFSDISCVFDLAVNDSINSATSESQVASTGILVDTLQKAQPLQRLVIPRKSVDDAFRELQGYIQMSKSLNTRRAS